MKNKAMEFVEEFNIELEKLNEDIAIQYVSNGFTEAILIPDLVLYDDNNYSSDYSKQIALSQLVKYASDLLEVANNKLNKEVDFYLAAEKVNILEKYPQTKVKITKKATMLWELYVSGEYKESKVLDDFMDGIKDDFEYIFTGCKLNMEW